MYVANIHKLLKITFQKVRDSWLDNIDWQKIQHSSESAGKYNIEEAGIADDSDSNDETDAPFSELDNYKQIIGRVKNFNFWQC